MSKIKERLCSLIDALVLETFGEAFYPCAPEDLRVNRGANKYNDSCSWFVYLHSRLYKGHTIGLFSYETMTELHKAEKLVIIGNDRGPAPIEIASTKKNNQS